ncbi:hypothetical protein IFM89_017777 [Coptis chinensis]|uniref:Ubiquitin-like domain-containing protein n=1 Tax=Coptis chinensis TaxID=261450 RepID=A0A835LVE1_9MAGN|nr:hypothetical protein IFM89_017777 [Coptis chinensis]
MALYCSSDEEDGNDTIYVKLVSTVAIKTSRLDTIGDVKGIVYDFEGYNDYQTKLLYAGEVLEDHKELQEYGISSDSTIYMISHSSEKIPIYISLPWITALVTINVNEWDTIKDVKASIEIKEGCLSEGFTLVYNGEHLTDAKPLAAYDIHCNSILNAIDNASAISTVFVLTPTGKTLEMDVRLSYTVEEVKDMIKSMVDVPERHSLRLYLDTRHLDDMNMLADYEIQNEAKLHLMFIPFYCGKVIHVRILNGKTIRVEVSGYDTIENVKKKIQEKEDIPIHKMVLIFSRKKLEDGFTLEKYDIKDESILLLMLTKGGKC